MTEHSSIVNAEFALSIAKDAPCRTEQEYEAILELLEGAARTLRGVFVGGQESSVPSGWRIDGIVYRTLDGRLDQSKEKLVQRLRASQFFAGESRRDKKRQAIQANMVPRWTKLEDAEMAIKFKQQGFDVRYTTGINGRPSYQFATLKEVK
jgi:hypothetical protein